MLLNIVAKAKKENPIFEHPEQRTDGNRYLSRKHLEVKKILYQTSLKNVKNNTNI